MARLKNLDLHGRLVLYVGFTALLWLIWGLAYALTGLFATLAGLSLTASTSIGTPVPGPYTLESVAAVVLGGVSLAGGRGDVRRLGWIAVLVRVWHDRLV